MWNQDFNHALWGFFLHTLYVLFSRLLVYLWSSVLTSPERLQLVYSPLELSELGNPWHTWVALWVSLNQFTGVVLCCSFQLRVIVIRNSLLKNCRCYTIFNAIKNNNSGKVKTCITFFRFWVALPWPSWEE